MSEIIIREIEEEDLDNGFLEALDNLRKASDLENSKAKEVLKKIENIPLEPYQRRNLTSEKFNTEHYLFDELVMVPLLFAGYGCSQKKIISNQIRTVDIFPTLLKILGIKFDENSRDGRSLVSLMNGKNCDELEAYMESNPLIQIKSNDVIGIRTSNYKYFRDVNESTKRVRLYDLVNDPFENINIAERNPEMVKEFEIRLQIILRQDNLLINENGEGSEAISNELKKMGYSLYSCTHDLLMFKKITKDFKQNLEYIYAEKNSYPHLDNDLGSKILKNFLYICLFIICTKWFIIN